MKVRNESVVRRILFWFFRRHRKEVIFILEAISQPPNGIVPTRRLLLLPYLLGNKKLHSEDDYDRFVGYLKDAGYILVDDNGATFITNEGRETLKNYKDFWLLRPIKIIQNALKENLAAIISFLALLISIISLISKK